MRSDLSKLFLATLMAGVAGCGGGGDSSAPQVAAAPVPAPAPAPTPAPAPAPAVNISTASTGTTAYGVLGTATTRVAFIPAPTGVLPVLLESSGNEVISAGHAGMSTATASTATPVPLISFSFPISACAVDSNDLKGICISYDSSKIGVMDLTTFATTLHVADITVTEFDSGAGTVPNSYSGGDCILCGVAADIGKKRFVVGGAGGFRVFAYGSTTAAAVYDIPVGENFAFLPQPSADSFIIAPEYEPNGGNRKLRVVDLEQAKTYAWTRNTDSLTDLGATAGNFQFAEVDAAAIDVNTKMIALSAESGGDFLLVDFAQATFDPAALTFTAPFSIAAPTSTTLLSRLTDVAISTSGDILLSHGEATDVIGVTQLPTAAGSGGTFPSGVGTLGMLSLNDAALDHSACGATYFFAGKFDPHGLSLYAGLSNGQRGLVIDNTNSCAALVDLAALTTAPHQVTNSNNIDTTAAGVSAMIKFVKLQ